MEIYGTEELESKSTALNFRRHIIYNTKNAEIVIVFICIHI